MLNKTKAYIFIFLFTALIAGKAFSVIPLAFGVGLVTGVETGLGTAVATSLAVHGAALFGYLLWDSDDPASTPSSPPVIKARLNPKAPLPTPPGWNPASGSSVKPSPPSTDPGTVSPDGYDYRSGYVPNGTPWATSVAAAAQYLIDYNQPSNPGTTYSFNGAGPGTPPTYWVRKSTTVSTGAVTFANIPLDSRATVKTCPTGYTLSGSTCNLTTPTAVMEPSDGTCAILQTNNSFSKNANDPDCSASSIPSNIAIAPNSIKATSADGRTTTEIKLNPDGSSTMTVSKSRTDGSNKTDTNTISTSAPDASTGATSINGTSSGVQDGTGVLAGNGSADGTEFPTDYNREDTQLEILESLNPTSEHPDTSLTAEKSDLDTKADEYKQLLVDAGNKGQNDENGLLTWDWFPDLPVSSGCTDAHVNIGGADRVFTGWCDTIGKLRDMMGYVLYVLTAFALFNVITGRTSGSD
ncbi:MAG: hypothetical protein WBI92_11655 [Cloacibacterium sp.]|uniref:hypothetical protein n=1 Tax=Cloacibacterium sp. TaxID=1913682 RepID=UPI003C78EB52